MFSFCGLGGRCSITGGKATTTRGRLVRREALEIALYTFKFVPAIDSIIAFMPPPAGQSPSMLFLPSRTTRTRSPAAAQTLPLEKPPLPTELDATEGTTIDQLTLPASSATS